MIALVCTYLHTRAFCSVTTLFWLFFFFVEIVDINVCIINRCNQKTQTLMKLKMSVFHIFINQPNRLLFISPFALMQNMFKLRNDDEFLLAFIADKVVFLRCISCILTSGQLST